MSAAENTEWEGLLAGIRSGDDASCQAFWDQYGPLIQRVADRHLSAGVRRRVGPESVMLSACRTFFRRAQAGEFDLPDAESVWRLLCAITVNKVRMKSRHHLRKKRGLDAEVHTEDAPDPASTTPTPADEVEFADQLQQLMARFSDEEREVLDWKLQQYTNDEIAQKLECSERTVRRMMKRIQATLAEMLDED